MSLHQRHPSSGGHHARNAPVPAAGGTVKRFPLSVRAARLVEGLPDSVSVRTIRAECPEVLDLLAHHWDHPAELDRTFKSLMFTAPGQRTTLNISFSALLEVASLRQHAVSSLKLWRESAWDRHLQCAR